MNKPLCLAILFAAAMTGATAALAGPVELHHRLHVAAGVSNRDVALTLDACGAGYDADLIEFLIAQRIPATIFVTKRWLDRNPTGSAVLLQHPDLFELEDHGTAHVAAVMSVQSGIHGVPGEPDLAHLRAEVLGAAEAITRSSGKAPRFYRGAGAIYDAPAMQQIEALGLRIAGFSVNADDGATLSAVQVASRLRRVQAGDIVIAHMNKPAGGTAEGFAAALPELLRRGLRFIKLSDARLVPA
jgi:peptidoglycan/xylan/chitin deacetylase (PgdA/CDA1 family)